MSRVIYNRMILADTSAIMALLDPQDPHHAEATNFFSLADDLIWCSVNVTSHELFTRVRYDKNLPTALDHYDFLRTNETFHVLTFNAEDENQARRLLEKYKDQRFSFHDALCAVLMLRVGIFKIFSFDRDFWIMGFEIFPGVT